jgi:hypothetical protein
MAQQSKAESLVQTGLLISLFIILIGLFVGTMYAFDCNLFLSLPLSFGTVILLHKVLDILIGLRMDTKKNSPHFGVIGLWSFLGLLAIPVNLYINHMVNVEIMEKTEIQLSGNRKVNCLDQLHQQYNKSYNAWLDTRRSNIVTDIKQSLENPRKFPLNQVAQNNNITVEQIRQIDRQSMITIQAGVDSNIILYDRMKFTRKEAQIFGNYQNYKDSVDRVFGSWQRFSLNKALASLDEKIKLSSDTLGAFLLRYTKKPLDAADPVCTLPSMINRPIDLLVKHLGPSFFLILLLVNGLLVLPYFLAPKKTYRTNKASQSGADDGVTRR